MVCRAAYKLGLIVRRHGDQAGPFNVAERGWHYFRLSEAEARNACGRARRFLDFVDVLDNVRSAAKPASSLPGAKSAEKPRPVDRGLLVS